MIKVDKRIFDVNICPFCHSNDIEYMGDAVGHDNLTPFHCHSCNEWFGVDDKNSSVMENEYVICYTDKHNKNVWEIIDSEDAMNVWEIIDGEYAMQERVCEIEAEHNIDSCDIMVFNKDMEL